MLLSAADENSTSVVQNPVAIMPFLGKVWLDFVISTSRKLEIGLRVQLSAGVKGDKARSDFTESLHGVLQW